MSDDSLAPHRQQVRNDLGAEFERKASDEWCTRYIHDKERMRSGGVGTVLELATPEGMIVPDGFVVPGPDLPPQEPARPRVMRGGPRPPSEPEPAEALPADRAARIEAARRLGWFAVRSIDSALGEPAPPRRNTRGGQPAAPGPLAVEVCWLNQTLRTRAPSGDLAELAGDSRILRVDLGKRLQREPPAREPGAARPAPDDKLARALEAMGVTRECARLARTGRGVAVAVIDSEIAYTHPAFQNRVHRKRTFAGDWNHPGEHGTAVAGVIAARGERDGVAPEAILYNYKVLGSLPGQDADDFDLACALQQALVDGARIANVSLGTPTPPYGGSREVRACDHAWGLGLTIVKSAGNFGSLGPGSITCPADARGVIAVGATDLDGIAVQEYSSRGPARDGKACPDVVAPGGRSDVDTVHSCLPDGTFGCCGAGTTLAAAHVSGLLALLLEEQPDLTPDQQREHLISRCTRLEHGDRNIQGFGFVRWI
jgi:serine protease AprX